MQTVTITLTATCDTSGAQQIPSDQPGTRRFERPLSLVPAYSGVRYYTFPGGCATYRFVSRKAHPPRWPSPSITRWRSSPGQRSSTTFGTPKVSPVRARCRMPGMTRPATPGGRRTRCSPARQAALLTAGVVALTAVVFALAGF